MEIKEDYEEDYEVKYFNMLRIIKIIIDNMNHKTFSYFDHEQLIKLMIPVCKILYYSKHEQYFVIEYYKNSLEEMSNFNLATLDIIEKNISKLVRIV
jgi:hypothetical protein